MSASRHPLLQEADDWAAEHGELLEACFARYDRDGAWPELDSLQHEFELADRDFDVRALAWSMPRPLGFPEADALILRVRGLSHAPAAASLLADWHAALLLAYDRWRDEQTAMLARADLAVLFDGDQRRVVQVSRLLLRESWAFNGGSGDETGDWSRAISSQVRVARGTASPFQLVAARDAVEFPAPPRPPKPIEPGSAGRTRLARGWNAVSHHPLWSAVLAGLVLAAVAGIWKLATGGGGDDQARQPTSEAAPCSSLVSASPPRPIYTSIGTEGQVEGGNILRGSPTGAPGSFIDPLLAKAGIDITVGLRISNPGPSFLSDVRVRVTLEAASSSSLRLVGRTSSSNADPGATTDSLVINLAGGRRACARYVFGSTRVRALGGGPSRPLPDGICQGGISVGDVPVPLDDGKVITFRLRLAPAAGSRSAELAPGLRGTTSELRAS